MHQRQLRLPRWWSLGRGEDLGAWIDQLWDQLCDGDAVRRLTDWLGPGNSDIARRLVLVEIPNNRHLSLEQSPFHVRLKLFWKGFTHVLRYIFVVLNCTGLEDGPSDEHLEISSLWFRFLRCFFWSGLREISRSADLLQQAAGWVWSQNTKACVMSLIFNRDYLKAGIWKNLVSLGRATARCLCAFCAMRTLAPRSWIKCLGDRRPEELWALCECRCGDPKSAVKQSDKKF